MLHCNTCSVACIYQTQGTSGLGNHMFIEKDSAVAYAMHGVTTPKGYILPPFTLSDANCRKIQPQVCVCVCVYVGMCYECDLDLRLCTGIAPDIYTYV